MSIVASKPARASRLLLAVGAPIVVLFACEVVSRVLDLAPPRPLVVVEDAGDGTDRIRIRALGISTDTPHVSPPFTRAKPLGAVRIAWFGESAAAGFPHHESSTPARWLEACLAGRIEGVEFDVVDCAIAGIAGDWLQRAAELVLPLDVDIAVVYAGNNEFLSAFVDRRRSRSDPGPLDSLLANSRFLRFLGETIGGPAALKPTRSPLDTRGHLEPPLGKLRDEIEKSFEANLIAIGRAAAAHGAKTLFLRPVGARRDWPPLSSVPRTGTTADETRTLRERLDDAAAALAANDLDAASRAIAAAAAIDPELPLVRFREGVLAERRSEFAVAVERYEQALDGDDRPTRVNSRLARRIEAAAAVVGAPYRDADAHFRSLDPSGITPPELLVDHVHLSIEGHYRLAVYVAERLRELGWPAPAAAWRDGAIVDFAAGIERLGIRLSSAVSSRIQLGFAAILSAYEQPANRTEHLSRAHRIFDEALAARPDHPRALCGKALLAAAEGRAADAIAAMESAYSSDRSVVLEVSGALDRFAVFRAILDEAGLTATSEGRFVAK